MKELIIDIYYIPATIMMFLTGLIVLVIAVLKQGSFTNAVLWDIDNDKFYEDVTEQISPYFEFVNLLVWLITIYKLLF